MLLSYGSKWSKAWLLIFECFCLAYYHPCFLRSKPFLAIRIQRHRVKGTGGRKPASPEMEPDFYSMSVLPPTDMAMYKHESERKCQPDPPTKPEMQGAFQQTTAPSARGVPRGGSAQGSYPELNLFDRTLLQRGSSIRDEAMSMLVRASTKPFAYTRPLSGAPLSAVAAISASSAKVVGANFLRPTSLGLPTASTPFLLSSMNYDEALARSTTERIRRLVSSSMQITSAEGRGHPFTQTRTHFHHGF